MSRLIAVLLLVGVLVAAIVYNVRARQAPMPQERRAAASSQQEPLLVTTAEATIGSISQTINCVGVVKSDRQASISTKATARILDIPVREGTHVIAGQLLVRLDLGDSQSQMSGADAGVEAARAQLRKAVDGKRARALDLDSQVAQARTGFENAKVKLQQAELGAKLQESATRSDTERSHAAVLQADAGVKQAEAALDQAEKTLKRVEFLYAHGGVPRVEVDGARTQVSIAQAQKEGADASLKQARAAELPATETAPLRDRVSRQDIEAARLGVRQADGAVTSAIRGRTESLRIADRDIEAAAAAVKQAEAGSRGVKIQLNGAVITSPISGMVTEMNAHPGELAQPGQPLMTIVSTDDSYVEASVPLRYRPLVRAGLPARITTASGESPISGSVAEILPATDGRTDPVRITIKSHPASLSIGLSVTVAISATPERSETLVPAEAVREEAGRSIVYITAAGRAERREVLVGPTDGARVALRSGVSSGDRVIVRAPDTLSQGARVAEAPGAQMR